MLKLQDLKKNTVLVNENHIVMVEPFDAESGSPAGLTHFAKITLSSGHVLSVLESADSISLGDGVVEKS